MNTTLSSSSARDRALILGGGGSTGNAWLIGVIAGLSDGGLDVTAPDLTVGTSAGATAAVQIAGAGTAELLGLSRTAPPPRPAGGPSVGDRNRPVVTQLDRMNAIIAASRDADDMRHRMSAAALERDAESDGEWSTRWRATVATRLPHPDWPERRILITAVDARTGEGVVFDRDSGVELVDAVAASTSSGLPHRIGEGRYLDGGFRVNAENADLATGYARVLVLSPFGGRSLVPAEWGVHLATQLDALRASSSAVATIFPDADAEHLFGPNAMDPTLRPAAADAGYTQGVALAPTLAPFWV